jgi:proliferating cell nuclear antigen
VSILRLSFREATTWKYAITAISKIIEEASFKLTQEGLRLRAMDPSAVVLVNFYIPREAFSTYEIEGEVSIGANMEELAKILRRARKGDELVLEPLPGGHLKVIFEGKGSRMFKIPGVELSIQEIPEISFEETFKCKLMPKMLGDVVKELKPISDSIEFYSPAESNVLYLKVQGEIAEAEIELSAASGALIEYESRGEARSKYTVDYLVDISAAAQAAEVLSIGFGVETPLRLTYELPYGGKLEFYVAPRAD